MKIEKGPGSTPVYFLLTNAAQILEAPIRLQSKPHGKAIHSHEIQRVDWSTVLY